MVTPVRASDWTAARGDKWSTHVSGMEATLLPVDEPLIDALELDAPYRIADVGCGGGGTTLAIRRRAPAGSVVHGFDLSPALVAIARGRAQPGDDALAFEVADVATTAPERPYRRLVSRFGVMFFEAPELAFANLARWLEPGGRFAFAVWGPPPENPWLAVVREEVARLVEIPPADPDAPNPFRYAEVTKLLALLTRAGFTELDVREWRGALRIGGTLASADAARFALAAFSSFAELLDAAGEQARNEAQRAVAARFTPHEEGGRVRLGACVRIVVGTRA